MKAQAPRMRGLRGVHVLGVISGFFGVTFAVNGLFIARAVGTFPGEDVKNSYVQGNDYNATLAQRAEQKRLGWEAEAGLEGGSKPVFVLRLKDATGRPVGGLDATLRWRWIGRDADDAVLALQERGPGEFVGTLATPGPGRLAATIEVRRQGKADPVFVAAKTLVTE